MKYFSMFSGIGGFEYAIHNTTERDTPTGETDPAGDLSLPKGRDKEGRHGAACVGFSEIDKYAIAIYQHHYPEHKNYGDATKIDPETIPDFDLLVGGFPCQAFSIAGKRGGFEDTRGTLFFDIARILKVKRPRQFVLENVKGLLSHDDGRTFKTIIAALAELGYCVEWQVLNSKNFGVPQNRERVFIVGHLGGIRGGQVFPIEPCYSENNQGSADIANCLDANYFKGPSAGFGGKGRTMVGTLRTHKDGEGFRKIQSGMSPAIPARARQNGRRMKEDGEPAFTCTAQDQHGVFDGARIRRLTPTECERLQAFPDGWTKFGVFIPENKNGKCAKTEVVAIVTDGKTKSVGFNWCSSPVQKCPRLEGEGYEKCKSVCKQNAHAEIEALNNFKGDRSKATLYIHGHHRICEECKKAAGDIPVVFGLPPEEISDSQRYKTLGNSVTTSVISAIMEKLI